MIFLTLFGYEALEELPAMSWLCPHEQGQARVVEATSQTI